MQYPNQYIEACLEGPHSMFKGLTMKDKEALVDHSNQLLVRKGDFLFREGEKARGLACLATGKAKVFKEGVGGREQIVKLVRQNGIIGYRTLFNDNLWAYSSAAIEDSVVCILDRNSVVRIMRRNSDLTLRFLKVISEELLFSNNRTLSLTQKHIRGRIAESLLILRDTYGYDEDGVTLNILLSREDLANLSNMTTSNAIRTLSTMAAEGIIGIRGRRISIIDGPTLEHICNIG